MRLAASLTPFVVAAMAASLSARAHEHGKYHHELRGTIVSVNPQNHEFSIKTYEGEVAECMIDSKTVIQRDNHKIELSDVQPGERVYCHCSAEKNGKHYSTELVVETKKKKR